MNDKVLDFYALATRKYPELFVGFDMVGYEDIASLEKYVIYINQYFEEIKDFKPKLMYHAGESFLRLNENCRIAVENFTLRIGHGLDMLKDPATMKVVEEKNIMVTANPVSNWMLGYVNDLNWHPAKFFKEFGIKIR